MAEEATQEATQEATTPETPEGEPVTDAQEGYAARENKELKGQLSAMQEQIDKLNVPVEPEAPSPPAEAKPEEAKPVMSQGDKDRFEFLLANQNKGYDGDDIKVLTDYASGAGLKLEEAESSPVFKSYLKDKRAESRSEEATPAPAPVPGRSVKVGETTKDLSEIKTISDLKDFDPVKAAEEAVERSQARRSQGSPTAI